LFVQIANFGQEAKTPVEGNWPWVRESQLKTLSVPETGMTVIEDIGDARNIHPTDKEDVGIRLSLVARHMVYGEKNVVDYGPMYKSMEVKNGQIILTFDDTKGGLVMDTTRHPGAKELLGFGIAGSDQNFVWAKAVIQENKVIVSADQVPNPVAVRYNWANNPPGNLYNGEGLPASPFRTDDWPAPIPDKEKAEAAAVK
jgi:sialate O-acetylesterase